MTFPLDAPPLDACVLMVLEKRDAYDYSLIQRTKEVVELSEFTLYPVLRHLQQSGYLVIYGKPSRGRNRRYYAITPAGRALLAGCRKEWTRYRGRIKGLLLDEKERRHEQGGIPGGPAGCAGEKAPVRGAGGHAVLL